MDAGRAGALLEEVGRLARRAGQAIEAVRGGPLDTEQKSDGSPVTRADRAAEAILVEGLRALLPGVAVVSEEGDVEAAVAGAGSTYWLVDPLDGTKEFLKGLPEYTVNVALVEAGVPVLGAIHVPASDCLYLAARGRRARRRDARGETLLVAVAVAHPRRAVVSRSHLSPETSALLARLGVAETVPRGSSLKMCAVAEGEADLYPRLGPTRLWDTAAGAAIAAEAGCDVVALDGRPLRYDLADGLVRPAFLVAAPGGSREACLRALAAGGFRD
ncbi:MAG TPA: 3'(2'),5'-bisphosphate nucleotidase CysQ [Vicinamibacteria bacterium]|nr:3'(2'),5'-bisphosphate nucleotidase CysQ [Vicinamibacteria bacterium]